MSEISRGDDLLLRYRGFVPTKKRIFELSRSATFFQEPYFLSGNRFVNLYWVEFNKKRSRFHLFNLPKSKKPLLKIAWDFKAISKVSSLAAINTCNFYLADVGREPVFCGYNLFVRNGQVLQFPSNDRVAVIEKEGSLEIRHLKAKGSLKIGSLVMEWVGTRNNGKYAARIFGVFDMAFVSLGKSGGRRAKQVVGGTTVVKCNRGRTLLGIGPDRNGKAVVQKKNFNRLSLFDYYYVIDISSDLSKQVNVGDLISDVWVGDFRIGRNNNAVSLSFSIPRNRRDIKKVVSRQVLPVKGKVRPLARDYFKSWSLILTTNNKVVFFLVDSYPYKAGLEGINLFELHRLISSKFDLESCAVCDCGQTSKLCLGTTEGNLQVFGNMHYVDYTRSLPRREGVNGRPIPSALIGYERI